MSKMNELEELFFEMQLVELEELEQEEDLIDLESLERLAGGWEEYSEEED